MVSFVLFPIIQGNNKICWLCMCLGELQQLLELSDTFAAKCIWHYLPLITIKVALSFSHFV